MNKSELCVNCGKEKASSLPGSITQWVLDKDHCACHKISKNVWNEPQTDYCPDCGKPLTTRRHGSMTQWIFQSFSCACQKPASADFTSKDKGSLDTSESSHSNRVEEELALDARQFPTDRYKALSQLGKGANGTVYLCRDRLLGIKVAVKTLHRFDNERLIAFQTEARATSKLNHPSILRLLDFGPTESGAPYMVLEYFDGVSLDKWSTQNGFQRVDDIIEIFEQVSSALSLAHQKGVFHRDLQPTNILVSKSSSGQMTAKLIDFGLAAMSQEKQMLTAQGNTVAGTPAYMPPDVVRGEKFDCRSEIYSLGCVMYKCLAGRPPFEAETALEMLRLHVEAPVPPLNTTGDFPVSPALEKLILKCLRKNPDDRYSSMDELGSDLERIPPETKSNRFDSAALNRTGTDSTKGHSWLWNPKLVAAMVAFISIIPIGVYLFYKPIDSTEKAKSQPKANEKRDRKSAKAPTGTLPGPQSDKKNSPITDLEHNRKELDATMAAAEGIGSLEEKASKGDLLAQRRLAETYSKGDGVIRDPKKSLHWALEAARGGDAESQNIVGYLYEAGEAVGKNENEAFKWFAKAAANGNLQALISLGRMHRDGIGTKKDPDAALNCFRKGIALGSPAAKRQLADMYSGGKGVKTNYTEALKLYSEASKAGDKYSTNKIGYSYMYGLGVPIDYQKATYYITESANAGCIEAHFLLAELYSEGHGVEKNFQKAVEHLQFGSERGDGQASVALAKLLQDGRLGKERIPEAVPIYKKAVEQGNQLAMLNLGLMYIDGYGCERDFTEGVRLIRKAAELGYDWAQYYLGFLYEEGTGVPRDLATAERFLSLAAEQGNRTAQNYLGSKYLIGIEFKKDYHKAFRWFSLAAENLHNNQTTREICEANWNLGRMYVSALGVPRDYKAAFKHFEIAAKGGHPEARLAIASMFRNGVGTAKNQEAAKHWSKLAPAISSTSRKAYELCGVTTDDGYDMKISKMEKYLNEHPQVFNPYIYNELRHLYVFSSRVKSMEYADLFLKHSILNDYTMRAISDWTIDKDNEKAVLKLEQISSVYSNRKYLAASCSVKAGDLTFKMNQPVLAKSYYLRVANTQDKDLKAYRDLANTRLKKLDFAR